MSGPVQYLVAALSEGPADMPTLARRIGYRRSAMAGLILQARAAGHDIRVVPAAKGSGELSTFRLVSQQPEMVELQA